MKRRAFTSALLSTGALIAAAKPASALAPGAAPAKAGFKLHYAPNFRQFEPVAGKNPLDCLAAMAAAGFRDIEDNGMMNRPVEEQTAIGKALEKHGMRMGVFVVYADFKNPTFTGHRLDINDRKHDKDAVRALLKDRCTQAIEVAKRVNAKWMTVVPGTVDDSLDREYQFLNVVDHLKFMAGLLEPHGLIMVLEPLNFFNHPGCFLERVQDGYLLCKAVASPSCKILNDLYHQQISVGNLIPNMEACWDETAYIQVGDNPGRKEPTTGEINYKNVFKRLHELNYSGVVGMEHGVLNPGPDGVARLIAAYHEVDSF